MRILAVAPGPAFSVQDVHTGWVEALRELGVRVAEFSLDDRIAFYSNVSIEDEKALSREQALQLAINGLYSACYQIVPDVLLVTSGFFVPVEMLDLIRSRGTKVVLIHTEEPYEHDRDIARAPHADINIVNDPTNLAAFSSLGTAWYQPHCYRPTIHRRAVVETDYRSEFCFVGTGYPSRIDFLSRVDLTGIDVALAGNWQGLAEDSPLRKHLAHDIADCLDNDDTVKLYQGCQVSANLYRREATDGGTVAGWAMGPREVELAATGTFFLRDPRGESDELLPMLPSFDSPEQFGDLLRYYLTDHSERERLAVQARRAVEDRTFTSAAQRLLSQLG